MTFLLVATIVLMGALLVFMALTGFGIRPASGPTTITPVAGTAEVAAVVSTPAVGGLTDVSDIAAVVVDAVVRIEITGEVRGRQRVIGSGSGVIIDSGGLIVTNAHVVEAGTGFEVVLTDGATYSGTLVAIDTEVDLALISIEATALTAIELGSTDGLLVGDPTIAVGNPLGLDGGPSVSTGIVSALHRNLDDSGITLTGVIQTDAAITEGSSGGALLDSEGKLIGITTAVGVSSVGIEGMGFAIPVEEISWMMSEASAL